MDLDRITQLKKRIALLGAVLCALAVFSALEGAIAYLREPYNSIRLLPGETFRLTGPLAPGAGSPDQMTSESSSDSISMRIEEVISGFWLGGKMWRGTLITGSETKPGQYILSVFGKEDQKRVGANVFQVMVYPDRAALKADSRSMLLRYSGLSPWVLAASFFVLVLICCAMLYVLSGKRDRLMAELGEAEVYHVTRDELGFKVYFGLGERHGLASGSKLKLLEPSGRMVDELVVESVSETDGCARAGALDKVRPGYLVKKF